MISFFFRKHEFELKSKQNISALLAFAILGAKVNDLKDQKLDHFLLILKLVTIKLEL